MSHMALSFVVVWIRIAVWGREFRGKGKGIPPSWAVLCLAACLPPPRASTLGSSGGRFHALSIMKVEIQKKKKRERKKRGDRAVAVTSGWNASRRKRILKLEAATRSIIHFRGGDAYVLSTDVRTYQGKGNYSYSFAYYNSNNVRSHSWIIALPFLQALVRLYWLAFLQTAILTYRVHAPRLFIKLIRNLKLEYFPFSSARMCTR